LHFANPWVVSIGTGVLLIVVIVRLPGGLAGLVHSLKERMVRGLHELEQPQAPPPAPVQAPD
jgi:hypothetical protein